MKMVAKMVLPALGLLLTLTLEFQALDRISLNPDKSAQPWTTFGKDLTRGAVLKRVSDHSCEQTLIVAIIALAFGAGPDRVGAPDGTTEGFDAGRLAVAIAYVYIVCRPIFAIGYLSADKNGKRDGMGRLPGLVIGGFWMNIGQSVILRALFLSRWLSSQLTALHCLFAGYCLYATLVSCTIGLDDSAAVFYGCIFFPSIALGVMVPFALAAVTPAKDQAADAEQQGLTTASVDDSATAAGSK